MDHTKFTVGMLIDALQDIPHDLPVVIEGCDCTNYVHKVYVYDRKTHDMRDGKEAIAYISRGALHCYGNYEHPEP